MTGLSHRNLARKEEFDQYVTSYIEDHEIHEIEKNFEEFFKTEKNGYWLLTGGPGMGKTAIMASLVSQYSHQCQCISYFFREGYSSDNDNRKSGFYSYILALLVQIYNLKPYGSDLNPSDEEYLLKTLWELHKNGEIHSQP